MQRTIVVSLLVLGAVCLAGAAGPADRPYTPKVAPASEEPAKVLKRFRMPKGVEARLWAAEPLLANPVSFCFDEAGRCYVAETFRLHKGVTDDSDHMDWLDDDLAARTVADRVAMSQARTRTWVGGYRFSSRSVRFRTRHTARTTRNVFAACRAYASAR
jgi:quinoprotein glucose dehydrogenase